MKRKGRNILLLFCLIGIVLGCSVKKNTTISRAYHNLTAQYNIYFNAVQSLKAGIRRIDQTIADDYTRQLPVFKSSLPEAATIATSEMEVAIAKCNKLITLHSITKSPPRRTNNSERYKRFASKGDYNNWVDDSYLLMGIASYHNHDYHRALENFNFVIRKFPEQPTRYDAFLWMARTYIETDEKEKALAIFNTLEHDGGFPYRLKQSLNLAQAYFYISDQPKRSIEHLKIALNTSMPRYEKLRLNYLLAQLFTLTNQPIEAFNQYTRLLKMRPNYQMAFNSRISKIELQEDDSVGIDQQLQKMVKKEINTDYLDRIYFVKSEIDLKRNKRDEAIDDLKKSVLYSTANNEQRAQSSLYLARMLFEQNDYILSAAYYDSTMAAINTNYPGYSEIKNRASSLRKLANALNIVSREDSLQQLAQRSDSERGAIINAIISDLQEKEQKRASAENADLSDQNYFRTQQNRGSVVGSDNQNLWYFYNPSTVGIGQTEFQRIWGKRKLEDNWRRKNKQSLNEEETAQTAQISNVQQITESKKQIADPKSVEYYLKNIPLNDSLMERSNDKIRNALFEAGKIYRTAFNDRPRSIELFEELIHRFPGSIYELSAFIELYHLNKELENKPNTDIYQQKIISKYPESKFSKFLLNPNYFSDLNDKEEAIEKSYKEALRYYYSYDYANAERIAQTTLSMNPDTSILSKVKFIAVVSNGANTDRSTFVTNLDQYIKSFPRQKTTEIANRIKTLIVTDSLSNYQQLVAKGYITDNIVNRELSTDQIRVKDNFDGKFSYEEDLFHYYVIAIAKDANVDINRLIYDIANYNLDYYTSTDFDIEPVNLNSDTQLIVVRSLPNKEESLIYFKSIIRKRNIFDSLKGVEYSNFMASSTNYRTIIADKDFIDYLRFFTQNYSPYSGSNVPVGILPEPQEMLSKIRKEEDVPEKGKFVVVQPAAIKDSLAPKKLVY